MSGRYATAQAEWDASNGKQPAQGTLKASRIGEDALLSTPKGLPRHVVSMIVSSDHCANCLGELDTGWECNDCGYDWKPWITASKALYDASFDRREG